MTLLYDRHCIVLSLELAGESEQLAQPIPTTPSEGTCIYIYYLHAC